MEPATTTGAPETTTAGPGLARLAAQLEFYLSDSSLSKDRRMRHEVLHNDDGCRRCPLSTDPWKRGSPAYRGSAPCTPGLPRVPDVRLAMFVEFNRIKELKARLEDLVAAVRQSTVLEVRQDRLGV